MSVNGDNLRKLRTAAGIGQMELSRRVGVTQGMISQLELGCRDCRPETLEKIAAELRCSVEDLAGKSALWVTFLRNCKQLSEAQLRALNEIAGLLAQKGPVDGTN